MPTKFEMEQEIVRLKNKKAELAIAKSDIQAKLAEIKADCGVMLEDTVYQKRMKERASYLQMVADIERQIKPINEEIRRLSLEKDQGTQYNISQRSIVESLVIIRDEYQSFAADKSRVGSMRQMAAEFVLKLNPIIRKSVGTN